jgi:hypothetical protein
MTCARILADRSCSCRTCGRAPMRPPAERAGRQPQRVALRVRQQHVHHPAGRAREDSSRASRSCTRRSSRRTRPGTARGQHVHRAELRSAHDPHRRHAVRRRAEEVDLHGDELPAAAAGRAADALLGQRRRRATWRCSSACPARARPRCRRTRSAAHRRRRARLVRHGVFNFEGGNYAKVIRLSPEGEPLIHAASTASAPSSRTSSLDDDTRAVDFDDDSITENTRSSYPSRSSRPRRERAGGSPEERGVPDGRRVRRDAAHREADARSRRCITSCPATRRSWRAPSGA